MRLTKQERIFYQLAYDWDTMALDEMDRYISKLKNSRLIALANFLRECKSHLESIKEVPNEESSYIDNLCPVINRV